MRTRWKAECGSIGPIVLVPMCRTAFNRVHMIDLELITYYFADPIERRRVGRYCPHFLCNLQPSTNSLAEINVTILWRIATAQEPFHLVDQKVQRERRPIIHG